jgi:hypothetical protein
MAGKGSKPRKVDGPKYRDNFDNIKWNKNNRKHEGKSNRNQARP